MATVAEPPRHGQLVPPHLDTLPLNAPHTTLPLRQGQVRLVDEGPRDGAVVLFVHGLSYPLEVWGPLVASLVPTGYRCIRYDLYGRGESTYTGGPLSPDALAQQALDVMDHAEVDRAHIVTLSNGDLITFALGASAPERVRTLSLVAPSGLDTRTMNLRTRLSCRTPGIATLFGSSLRKRLARRMQEHAAHLPPEAPKATASIYAFAASTVLNNPAFAAAAASQLGHMPTAAELPLLVQAYADAACPTLLIHYGEESDATAEGVQLLVEGLPDARNIRMAKGGHMGLTAYPDALASVLLESWSTDL